MFPHRIGFVSLFVLFSVLLAPSAFAQGALGKTDYGKSMNTDADLVNSLVPGPQKYWKGEKKAEVDAKTLQSKTTKDPMFQGGLMDVGLDWTADKMGKPQTNATAKTEKKTETAAGKEEPKQAQTTGEKEKTAKPGDAAGSQHKEQPQPVAADKSSEKEKSSAKPDGDH